MDGRERARRAYEVGRGGLAAWHALAVVPFALVGIAVGGDTARSLIGALALGALAWGLVFRGGPPGRAVPAGLAVGIIPFALPLLVRGQVCPMGDACSTWCMAACLLGGTLAGAWLGARSLRHADGLGWLIAGAGVAMGAGALGCSCIGAGGLAGMAVSLALAAPTARWIGEAALSRA
jgi:hypothetical protein